ncbi:MAG TPA: class I SAM-dependent methyltransferase [Stellaceae bacterium]|nr:class I SAM-dependent methyltransferase [Stellaceae bacterium]
MSGWTAGYVSGLEYVAAYNRMLAPLHLALTCALGGAEPPALEAGYAYCEFGCGQGLTVNTLAAANRHARFVGVDFNPAHIARAKKLAAAAGLDNAEFLEASFEELLAPGGKLAGAEFDVVTMHGVYSWVSRENRRALVELTRRHVKPSGLIYVSYNSMPGWAPALPLQRLLLDGTEALTGGREEIEQAIKLASEIAENGAVYDKHASFLATIRDHLEKGHHAYLAHEYLNRYWDPQFFADVARDFAEAKASFAASATLIENYPHLTLTDEQQKHIAAVPRQLRETITDFYVGKQFRRDLFVRGARKLNDRQRERCLREMRLALARPRAKVELTLNLRLGEAKLTPQTYEPIFDALAEGPRVIGELLDLPALRQVKSTITAVELAGILVGTDQAVPAREVDPTENVRARRFSAALADTLFRDGVYRSPALASAVIGSALTLQPVEFLAGVELARTPDAPYPAIAEAVLARLARSGEGLTKDGKEVTQDAEMREAFVNDVAATLSERAPLWRQLGIV